MSAENILDKVKKLREITGVGFKDCKNAIDENNGDIEKSIEFLRKKGIAKANKKMLRVAADGLVSIYEKENKFAIIEVNSETDFVAAHNAGFPSVAVSYGYAESNEELSKATATISSFKQLPATIGKIMESTK